MAVAGTASTGGMLFKKNSTMRLCLIMVGLDQTGYIGNVRCLHVGLPFVVTEDLLGVASFLGTNCLVVQKAEMTGGVWERSRMSLVSVANTRGHFGFSCSCACEMKFCQYCLALVANLNGEVVRVDIH